MDELSVPHAPEPLNELEEAALIAVTGCTGLTMPDRPFQDARNDDLIKAKPNLTNGGQDGGQPRQRAGDPLLHDQRQRHVLHAQNCLIRSSTRLVPWKERKAVCADLRAFYTAADEAAAAREALQTFECSWGKHYP